MAGGDKTWIGSANSPSQQQGWPFLKYTCFPSTDGCGAVIELRTASPPCAAVGTHMPSRTQATIFRVLLGHECEQTFV